MLKQESDRMAAKVLSRTDPGDEAIPPPPPVTPGKTPKGGSRNSKQSSSPIASSRTGTAYE